MTDDEDRPHLEKQLGHELYGKLPSIGKIAIVLLLVVVVCAIALYWCAETRSVSL